MVLLTDNGRPYHLSEPPDNTLSDTPGLLGDSWFFHTRPVALLSLRSSWTLHSSRRASGYKDIKEIKIGSSGSLNVVV